MADLRSDMQSIINIGEPALVRAQLPDIDFLPLWARLHGHGYLWHRTSLPSLKSILRDAAIFPNSGQYPYTFSQLENSFGRQLRAVSLFDFDSEDETKVLDHEVKWMSFICDSALHRVFPY